MQESSTPQLPCRRSIRMIRQLGTIILIACSSSVFAQISEAVTLPITTDAYPKEGWKPAKDFGIVLETNKQQTATKLSNPNLTAAERALFTGFELLLNGMQADLPIQKSVDQIAINNYNKTVAEAATNPALEHMSLAQFDVLYENLVFQLRP